MDASFIDMLDDLREKLGFPFIITSGYRCPKHNKEVSNTGEAGPHTTGRAADISASGAHALDIIVHGYRSGFKGIGAKQKGQGRFIHLDDIPRPYPTFWSY